VIQISIQRLQKLPKLLMMIFIFLFVMNFIVQAVGYVTGHGSMLGLLDLFKFASEKNIPTYFSSLILLISSLLLYLIYHSYKKDNPNDRRYWLVLSIVLLYLSVDELATIHELLIQPTRDILGTTASWFHFAWVIPGMAICLILAAYFLKFYLRLPPRYKLLFGISALIFVGAVIGMEIIDGFFAPPAEGYSLVYVILTTIEESLEMIGIILFIYSLIDYIKSSIQTTTYLI
jgi:hypothetical protein